jgi:hypothetical protein
VIGERGDAEMVVNRLSIHVQPATTHEQFATSV